MKLEKLAAPFAALALAGAIAFGGALVASAQTDPPPADMCKPGFIITTIAGSVSCQPAPRVVVTPAPAPPVVVETPEPEPVAPAPAPVAPVAPAPNPPATCVP